MLQEYDKEVDLGDRLFHYVGKLLVKKQAYQIRSDIIAFIRDNQQEVEELNGNFLKKIPNDITPIYYRSNKERQKM